MDYNVVYFNKIIIMECNSYVNVVSLSKHLIAYNLFRLWLIRGNWNIGKWNCRQRCGCVVWNDAVCGLGNARLLSVQQQHLFSSHPLLSMTAQCCLIMNRFATSADEVAKAITFSLRGKLPSSTILHPTGCLAKAGGSMHSEINSNHCWAEG